MQKKLILIIIIVLGVGAGILLDRFVLINPEPIYQEGYNKGYEQAWGKAFGLIEKEAKELKTPREIYELRGKVNQISSDSLEIEAFPVTKNPLSGLYKYTIRIVLIDDNTKIIKRVMKTKEEIKRIQETQETKDKIDFWEEIEIPFSEIQKEAQVRVFSETDILTSEKFLASKIILE